MTNRATSRPLSTLFAAITLAWGGGFGALAQTAPYLMSDTVVTDCIGELTDSGGPEEAYGNNENLVFTVDSESPLDVVFLGSVDIEAAAPGGAVLFDYLVLHDGPDLNAPVLDTLYGSIANPPAAQNLTKFNENDATDLEDNDEPPQGVNIKRFAAQSAPSKLAKNLRRGRGAGSGAGNAALGKTPAPSSSSR